MASAILCAFVGGISKQYRQQLAQCFYIAFGDRFSTVQPRIDGGAGMFAFEFGDSLQFAVTISVRIQKNEGSKGHERAGTAKNPPNARRVFWIEVVWVYAAARLRST